RARAGLGEELAPYLVGRHDRLQEAPLLLLGPVGDQGWADEVQPDAPDDLRRAGRRQLLLEEVVLDGGRAAPAVLPGPVDPDPAALVQLALPAPQVGDLLRQQAPGGDGGRPMAREPGAQLGAEGLLGGRE